MMLDLYNALYRLQMPENIIEAVYVEGLDISYGDISYSPSHPNIKFSSLVIPHHTPEGMAGVVYIWHGDEAPTRVDVPPVIWQAMNIEKPDSDIKTTIEKLANFKIRVDRLNHDQHGHLNENLATGHFLGNSYYELREHLLTKRKEGNEQAVCALVWLDEWLNWQGNTANATLEDSDKRMELVWERGMRAKFGEALWRGYWEHESNYPDFPETRYGFRKSRWESSLGLCRKWCKENNSNLIDDVLPAALSASEMGKRSGLARLVDYSNTDAWIAKLQIEYQDLVDKYGLTGITEVRDHELPDVRNFNNRLRGFLEHSYPDPCEREDVRHEIIGSSGRFRPPVPGTELIADSAPEAVVLTLLAWHSRLKLEENITLHAGTKKTWDVLFYIDETSVAIEIHPDQHGKAAEEDIADKEKRCPVDNLIWGRTPREVMYAIAGDKLVLGSLFPDLDGMARQDVEQIFNSWLLESRAAVLSSAHKAGYRPARESRYGRLDGVSPPDNVILSGLDMPQVQQLTM